MDKYDILRQSYIDMYNKSNYGTKVELNVENCYNSSEQSKLKQYEKAINTSNT